MKLVNSVLVVGGGTAGLIAAIILKKKLAIQVDVVHSQNIGIIGVGEGSTEHWKEFMEFAGIDHYDLIKSCDATYKCGIMFENWTETPYLHSVAGPYNNQTGQYKHVYAKLISENSKNLHPKHFWHSHIHKWFINRPEAFTANQFHFNTYKLNEYLINFAKTLNINIINDEIKDIKLDNEGNIQYIQGNNQYHYDFYIDSTGFRRLLMNKLGAKWKSYSKYLQMNSAVVFQTNDEDNYNFWTLSRAMDSGWLFRIPVWGRYGNGYIYNAESTNEDNIQKELNEYFGRKIEIKKHFKFDPGALEQAWIKNCAAIGLSSSFVEPLEASSIGTSIQQSFLLMHKLSLYDQRIIDSYNDSFNDIMNNILEFIFLHYRTKKNNNEFWKSVAHLAAPGELEDKLNMWKHRLPIKEDFKNLSNYILFREDNFILVMEGLDMFDRNSILKEYQKLHSNVKYEADKIINHQRSTDTSIETIPHKHMLKLIRENF